MPLTCTIQWLAPTFNTGNLRVCAGWDEPLRFAATVRRRARVWKIYAAFLTFDAEIHRLICRAAQARGVRRIHWKRHANGRVVWNRVEFVDGAWRRRSKRRKRLTERI